MNLLDELIYKYYLLGEIIRLHMLQLFLTIRTFFAQVKVFRLKITILSICYFKYKIGKLSSEEYKKIKEILNQKPLNNY